MGGVREVLNRNLPSQNPFVQRAYGSLREEGRCISSVSLTKRKPLQDNRTNRGSSIIDAKIYHLIYNI